jgi:hypothetical protein
MDEIENSVLYVMASENIDVEDELKLKDDDEVVAEVIGLIEPKNKNIDND